MKKIAVITGASSGMGRRFAETVQEFGTYDEIWAIARRVDRLEELKNHTAFPVRTISLDLSDPASYETYAALLREEQPEVGLLINASGFGKFRAVMDTPLEVNLNMVDLNCKAVMALCQLRQPDHQYCVCCGVSAHPVYQRLRRDKGSCSALQPCAQPRAEKAGGACHGGMPVLDKDRIL